MQQVFLKKNYFHLLLSSETGIKGSLVMLVVSAATAIANARILKLINDDLTNVQKIMHLR